MKVFLGGTCNNSTWRDELIPQLKIDYFNPVVENWTPECQEEEIRQRKICDYILYVITPDMKGVYSIAEAVDDSNKRPDRTLFCVITEHINRNFKEATLKSLEAVEKLIKNNGSQIFDSLSAVANYLNNLNNIDILDVIFDSDDLGRKVSVREFLQELLTTLWEEEDGFNGKRPFGNSGWKCDIYIELTKRGIIEGKIEYDKDGNILYVDYDSKAADKLIYDVIRRLY